MPELFLLHYSALLNKAHGRFGVKAKSSRHVKAESGSLIASEYIGPEIPARNLLTGDVLDSRPPVSPEEDVVAQPVRDCWLPNGRSAEKCRDAVGKLHLASGDLDGATQGSNVIWLHGRQYKAPNDYVKKPPYMTGNKAPYMLDFVAVTKKKARAEEPRLRRAEELKIWPADNRTANARFEEAFEEWKAKSPPGQKRRTQEDLVRACNLIVGFPIDREPPYVSQPMISQLLRGQVDASTTAFLDVLAEAMGFRSVWIRTGVGERRLPNTEAILAALRAAGLPVQ